jgi:hypothetical protein
MRFSYVAGVPTPGSIYGEIRWSGPSTWYSFDPSGVAGEWNGVAGLHQAVTLERRHDPDETATRGMACNFRMAIERMPGFGHPPDQTYAEWLLGGPPYFGALWWMPDAPYYWTVPQDGFEFRGGPRFYASELPFSMPPNINQGPMADPDSLLALNPYVGGDVWDDPQRFNGGWTYSISGFYISKRLFGGSYPPTFGGGNPDIPGNIVPPWNDPPTGAPGAAADYVDKHLGESIGDTVYVAARLGDGRTEPLGGWPETAVLGGYVPDWLPPLNAPGTPENPFSPPAGDPGAYYTLSEPRVLVSPPPQYDIDIIEYWAEPSPAPVQPIPGLLGGNRRGGVIDLATGRAIAGGYGTVDVETAVVTPGGPGWGGSGV